MPYYAILCCHTNSIKKKSIARVKTINEQLTLDSGSGIY